MKQGLALLLLLAGLTLAPADAAPPQGTEPALTLNVSEGRLIAIGGSAATVFVADPTVADVQAPTADHVLVLGKKAGHTTFYALDGAGRALMSMKVAVKLDTEAPRARFAGDPGADGLTVTGSDSGYGLRGEAANAESAANALGDIGGFTKDKIDDQAHVRGSVQVSLRVRIAEVSRNVTKNLGVNWNNGIKLGSFALGLATGRNILSDNTKSGLSNLLFTPPTGALGISGGTKDISINGVVDALATEGMVKILAEPTLTAVSGQPASFLAGGEFPIPVSQNSSGGTNSITIVFKQYGVSLNFVPTVMAANHISIHVRPEVSELTNQGEVSLNGLIIPALTVRRADTTVELGSGESFVIAGLLQNKSKSEVDRVPGLGDLPVLGPLFRSTDFERNETELLIFVTPYIVRPIDDPTEVRLPTDGIHPPNDFEQMFLGRVSVARPEEAVDRPRLVGDVGFDLR